MYYSSKKIHQNRISFLRSEHWIKLKNFVGNFTKSRLTRDWSIGSIRVRIQKSLDPTGSIDQGPWWNCHFVKKHLLFHKNTKPHQFITSLINTIKLTSESDSPTPIILRSKFSRTYCWVFIGLAHTEFWLAWADRQTDKL